MIDETTITDCTCKGECSRCGNCCGLFIPFNDEDITRIKEYVKEHNIKPQDRLNKLTGSFDARCCFYDTKNKVCTIYPVRPFVCKDFICSRENWKQKRDEYERRAKYNSTLNEMIMATFDDKIYNDYAPIILYAVTTCQEQDGKVDDKKLLELLMTMGRLDVLYYFSAINENGDKIEGIDLLK